jgi:hypothetical protein
MICALLMPQLLLAQQTAEGLNRAGLAIMVLSITLVTLLSAFCLWRILREPEPSSHHHAPLDIDTDKP